MNTREKKLKKIIDDTLWMAIRYSHGRSTYASSMVRDAVQTLHELYPDFKLREDITIEPPSEGVVGGMRFREDWLDDLFKKEE